MRPIAPPTWFLLLVCLGAGCVRMGFEPAGTGGGGGEGLLAALEADGGVYSQTAARTEPVDPSWSPAPAAGQTVEVIAGVQGVAASYLRRFLVQATVQEAGPALRLDALGGATLRGLSPVGPGELLAGNGFAAAAERVSRATTPDATPALESAGTFALTGGGAAEEVVVHNVHGACALPNGHLILGEHGSGPGNAVAEYAPAGNGFVFVRSVYLTNLVSGSMSHCAARSSSELYLADYAANTDEDGDVVRLALEGGTWKATHRFDMSAFGVAGHLTGVYSFVLHTNGQLYIFPLRRFGNRLRRLIRCPTPDIRAKNCSELGELPPDTTTAVNGPDAIQGAVQLPGSDDLLFATNRRIYRYSLADERWDELFDMWAGADLKAASGAPDTMAQLRNIVAR
jgi:hypothetical protein